MAGFFGFGNYAKPGKGVKKDAPKKKRFFQFFEIYFRKFWKLVQLNLIYFLFCIPIITIGPATAAMTKIVHCFTEEKPVFLFSDFWEAFKSNFEQGFVVGILQLLITFCIVQSLFFYWGRTAESGLYWALIGIVLLVLLLFIFSNFYVYLIMATVNLKVVHILKNSFLLAFLGVRTNFLTLIFTALLVIPCVLWFPLTIPLMILLLYSTITMITVFNSFQYIYRYMVKPYYEQQGLPDPYAEEEEEYDEDRVFEDATE